MVIDNSGNILNRPVVTAGQPVKPSARPDSAVRRQDAAKGEFESILRQKQAEGLVKFSKHAEYRLKSRNISLTAEQRGRIGEAVAKAESKGIRDSLVLMDNLAFVVNVRNRTVITVANSDELKENVFTNIDGTVII
ncbi:MAG: TIGR02530 family flagellar biosynthesis protein [Bacillota bacterium]